MEPPGFFETPAKDQIRRKRAQTGSAVTLERVVSPSATRRLPRQLLGPAVTYNSTERWRKHSIYVCGHGLLAGITRRHKGDITTKTANTVWQRGPHQSSESTGKFCM